MEEAMATTFTTTTTTTTTRTTAPTILQSIVTSESDTSINNNHGPAIASPSPPPSVAEVSPAQEEEEEQQEEETPTASAALLCSPCSPSSSATATVAPTTTTTTSTTAATAASRRTATATATTTTHSSATHRDVEDGKHFVNRKFQCPHPCKEYAPTLEELQKYSFSEYVRKVVLEGARVSSSGEDQEEEASKTTTTTPAADNNSSKTRLYAEGMAKVTLPKGFWKEEGIGQDRTGRGPAWQKGTPLGDLVIPNPIKQCVRGIGGVYEYTLLDQPSVPLHAFREMADAYQEQQLSGKKRNMGDSTSSASSSTKRKAKQQPAASSRTKRLQHRNEIRKEKEEEQKESTEVNNREQQQQQGVAAASKREEQSNDDNDNNKSKEKEEGGEKQQPSIEELERKFWKRLGPTMPPAIYGADMEGSLFGDDPAYGWNLGKLDSFLHLLGPNLPGVTSPYLYMGMWASVFAVHTEDMNLLSINYLHAGAPKIWYAIAPGPDARRLEALSEHYFSHAHRGCKQFLRHKRCLLSPMILKKAGIKFTMQVQNPGDAMITMPGGYHFGFNSGFNVAEATNFGVPEWIPFGHEARICMCRPDSVRIDMIRLEKLLMRYTKENKRKTSRRRKSFRDWGILHARAHMKLQPEESDSDTETEDEDGNENKKNVNSSNNNTPSSPSRQPKKPKMKEFWVEVMAPVPSSQRGDYGRRVSTGSQPRKHVQPRKNITPKKRPRSKGKQQQQQQQQQQPEEEKEVWHLAKPMTRKGLVVNAKVLVMIPGASTMDEPESSDSSDSDNNSEEEEDEQCFAGIITEFTEEHCRVHFDRLPRDDDVWMHIDSAKLFLDGGKWDDLQEKQVLPPKHYWQELDSKRRCV